MSEAINILIVRAPRADSVLVEQAIRDVLPSAVFTPVETEADYRSMLASFHPDIIISDLRMPAFDGILALAIARTITPDVPFIIVTDSQNEDTAVECLKSGAWDYVIKENLIRLGPAVVRSLQEKDARVLRREAESALQKLSQAVWQSPVSVEITDENGIIEYVNPKFVETTGYTEREVIGANPRILKSGEMPAEEYTVLWETILSGREWRGLFHNRKKNGTLFWERASISPVRDGEGRIKNFVAVKEDITSQMRMEFALRESEERNRVTFEQAAVGIAHVATDGRWVSVNQRLCDIVGYPRKDLLGLTVQDITHPDDLDADLENVRRVLAGEIQTYSIEKRYLRRGGSLVWVNLTVSLVRTPTGEPEYFISIIEDISRRKQTEEVLVGITSDLRRSNRDLEQFAYVASHDLQEPLRMVSSYVQLLERRYKDILDSDGRDFIAFAVDGARRMEDLIGDLLQFSRIQTQEESFVNVDCARVLNNARILLASSIERHSAVLTCGALPTVTGDESQLERLFQNLIDNGIKFHGDNHPIVHVSATDGGAEWIFSVKDSGIGIDPKYHERIFQIFQRLHDRTQYTGTGIGLAIAKRIVERHGGTIWVESDPGKGASFLFTLPKTELRDGNVVQWRDLRS